MSFNIKRFFTLIRRDLLIFKKPLMYGLILIPFCIMMIAYLQGLSEEVVDAPFLLSWFGIFLFGGGLLFTSAIMWEFRSTSSRAHYLTLPASNLEKMGSRWLYSLILYPLFLVLIFALLAQVNGISLNTEENSVLGMLFKVYLLAHSVMFLFAVWYNRYVAPKAILTLTLLFFALVIIVSILFRLAFNNIFDGWSFDQSSNIEPKESFQQNIENVILPLLQTLLWFVLPIFLWIVAYFKMKEKEA